LIATGLAVTLGLAGCVITPLPPPGAVVGEPGGPVVVAPVAPPAPIAETVLVAPAPGYIWIGGYWSWVGGRHVWTRGYWSAPRPGYRWVPRHWEHGAGGWHQGGGHWAR
jgi:WXXGXW repeat (2 copies)